jgi:hypothetical protein
MELGILLAHERWVRSASLYTIPPHFVWMSTSGLHVEIQRDSLCRRPFLPGASSQGPPGRVR